MINHKDAVPTVMSAKLHRHACKGRHPHTPSFQRKLPIIPAKAGIPPVPFPENRFPIRFYNKTPLLKKLFFQQPSQAKVYDIANHFIRHMNIPDAKFYI